MTREICVTAYVVTGEARSLSFSVGALIDQVQTSVSVYWKVDYTLQSVWTRYRNPLVQVVSRGNDYNNGHATASIHLNHVITVSLRILPNP